MFLISKLLKHLTLYHLNSCAYYQYSCALRRIGHRLSAYDDCKRRDGHHRSESYEPRCRDDGIVTVYCNQLGRRLRPSQRNYRRGARLQASAPSATATSSPPGLLVKSSSVEA